MEFRGCHRTKDGYWADAAKIQVEEGKCILGTVSASGEGELAIVAVDSWAVERVD
jgi:hypothetical protein